MYLYCFVINLLVLYMQNDKLFDAILLSIIILRLKLRLDLSRLFIKDNVSYFFTFIVNFYRSFDISM